MTTLTELSASRELLANLVSRELRGKYKRSALGWAWSLINPIALAAMFTLVFSVVFQQKAPEGDPSGLTFFPLHLLCALLPWTFLSNGMTGSIASLTSNVNLVKKVYFPREVLVGAAVMSFLVTLVIEMAVLVVGFLVAGNNVLPYLPVVVLLMLLQTAFVVGVGLALSVLNVYFRDIQHFLTIFLQLWFYASPVIYPVAFVEDAAGGRELLGVSVITLYRLNPMVGFIESYRALLYDLRLPAAGDLLWITVASLSALAIGWRVFQRFEPRLAEEL
ncbi:MAG TPA: ABC transporter permease [Mycobacteriales bacterium]|nr:ABC transporter permease [Mycobacteriales bacterium]